jgi:hypothetical protein
MKSISAEWSRVTGQQEQQVIITPNESDSH